MIIVILGLISLSAIYFTRFFYKRNSKIAATAIALLFAVIIAWTYFLFIFDVADFGFSDVHTRESLLFGSDIYSSFVNLNANMALLPTTILQTIVAVAALAFSASVMVILDGVFRVAGEIYRVFKAHKNAFKKQPSRKTPLMEIKMPTVRLIRLYCRANC